MGRIKLKKISFQEILNILEELLKPSKSLSYKDLIPDEISRLIKKLSIDIEWKPIMNWHQFETGIMDVEESEFLQIIFGKENTSGNIIIINDECFTTREGFLINFEDIQEFVSVTFPGEYKMDFFQPRDLIFISCQERKIALLHHEGYVSNWIKIPNSSSGPPSYK